MRAMSHRIVFKFLRDTATAAQEWKQVQNLLAQVTRRTSLLLRGKLLNKKDRGSTSSSPSLSFQEPF
jgi:hypothetical protein